MEEKLKKQLGERKQLKSVLEDFNVGVLLYSAQKSILWIVLFFIVSVAISFFYLRHTQQIYSSKVTLMRKVTKQTQILGVADLLSEDKTEIDIEIQLLKSKLLLSEALDSLPLRLEYYTKGKLSKTEFYKNQPFDAVLSDYDSSLEEVEIEMFTENNKEYTLNTTINGVEYSFNGVFGKEFSTPFFTIVIEKNKNEISTKQVYVFKVRDFSKVIDEIASSLIVSPINSNSKTVQIVLEGTNPYKAYDVVNALSKYYLEFDRIKKGESIDRTIEFLDEQIENFGKQYNVAQDSLKKFRFETGFIDPSLQIKSKIDENLNLEKTKLQLEMNQNALAWLVNYLNSGSDLSSLSGIMLTGESHSFQSSIQKIIGLQTERNLKLLNVTPDHPSISLINNEIASLKANLLNQINLTSDKERLEAIEINKKIAENNQSLFVLPDQETLYSEILRENDMKRQYYLGLVSKKNMYMISKAGIVSDYIILQPPRVNKAPISPNVMMIRMMGVGVGLFLGLMLIAVRYLLHTKLSSLNEVEASSNANLLGIIPKYKDKLDRSAIVVTDNPKSSISEAFRSIRANLEFLDSSKDGKAKIITTTSTIPGEGKTFVGINLAAIFSLLDKKVVILDFDLRKPRIAKIFEVDSQKGISTILIGRSTIEECIYNTGIKNLDLIASGPVPPNPAELITKDETLELIEALRSKYDYIFIDTPPVGLVTDALELLKMADYPLYVLRADYSDRAFLENTNKLIFDNEITKLSVVLNDFGRGASASTGRYGYGYGYGYGYTDGMGYYSDDKSSSNGFLSNLISKIKQLVGL